MKAGRGAYSVLKRLALAAAFAAMTAFVPALAQAASLTVDVRNVSPKGGIVSLALFTAANYDDDDHPTLSRDVQAISPVTTIHLTDLKPGVYAIKMMQDINRNGEFDTSLIGLPEEPYGFSNDAEPVFSEPSFKRTSFRVVEGENHIAITLSNTADVEPVHPKQTAKR